MSCCKKDRCEKNELGLGKAQEVPLELKTRACSKLEEELKKDLEIKDNLSRGFDILIKKEEANKDLSLLKKINDSENSG